MEPGSHADTPPERTSHRLADIVGTLIALLTLTLPILAIGSFSSVSISPWQPSAYPLLRR
jgi:hypothetical protein